MPRNPVPQRSIYVGATEYNAYGRGLLLGVIRHARTLGHWRLVPLEVGPQLLEHLARERPDGIIAQLGGPDTIAAVARSGLPTINLSSRTEPQPLPRVISDPAAVARLAVEHFLSCGFQHFAFAGVMAHGYARLRAEAFRDELRRRALEGAISPVRAQFLTPGTGLGGRWLAALPKPVAVLCSNDSLAAKVVVNCRALRLEVPEQVAVLGIDNDEITCELSEVPLSSIDVDPVRIGQEAARRMEALLQGHPLPPVPILVPPRGCVSRASTATLVFRNPVVGEAMRYLGRHEGEAVSVKQMTVGLGVSRRTLERNFQEVLGRSPRQEIEERRCALAERLLRDTALTVGQVARRAGYTDVRLLIQAFRRRHQRTPLQWRSAFR